MKHLRIFNLLVVLLLMSAWVPLPQSFSGSSTVLAATYSGTFTGLKPATGTTAAKFGTWPTFQWIFKPANGVAPDNMALLVATDKAFTKLVVNKIDLAGTATSYQPTDQLVYNTILYWKVQAISGGAVASSATQTAYSYSEPVGPLSDPVMDSLRPELRWAAPIQTQPVPLKSYTVELAENSTFTLNKKIFANILDNRFDVPVNLKGGVQYWWHVQSVGTYGKSAFTTAGTFTTTTMVPPAVPVLTSPINGFNLTNYQPQLKWTGPIGTGISYNLQIATNLIFSDAAIAYHKEGLTNLLYDFKTVGDTLDTGTYYWRVQSVLTDTGTVKSGWSKPFLFRTPSEVTVTVTDRLVGNPLQNVDVWATTNSACSQDAKYLLAKEKTLADGTVTLKGITKGTRFLCAWPDTYALFKGTLAVVPGKAYSMAMPLVKPTITIYLTWAARPSDLDVHLWLPTAYQGVDSAGHIYPDGQRGSTIAFPWAKILNDASSATLTKKTETITIQNRYPGDYYFAVRNRTNEGWFPPNNPNAKPYVTVKYNGVWVNFNDPTDKKGAACITVNGKMAAACRKDVPLSDTTTDGAKWWLVFRIDGETGQILWTDAGGNPTNRLVKESDAPSVLPYDPAGGTAILP